jgi:hypothetical protein
MIPVVYVHTGGIPDYLKMSVEQAARHNQEIILLSDKTYRAPKLKQLDVGRFSGGVRDFENSYRHMSSNTRRFELICIVRWFMLRDLMNASNIDVCYYTDSDVMLYDNMTAVYPYFEAYSAVFNRQEDQGDYRWSASACCSFWTKKAINEFCDFASALYTPAKIKTLEEKWDYHQKNNIAGGICDMTLLYLFSLQTSFCSLTRPIDGFCFDQNMRDLDNYYKDEYEGTPGRDGAMLKKIRWEDGRPFGFNRVLKSEVRFAALAEYAKILRVENESPIAPRRIARNAIGWLRRVARR